MTRGHAPAASPVAGRSQPEHPDAPELPARGFRGYIVGVSEKKQGVKEKAQMTTARPPRPGDPPLPAGEYSSQHEPSAANLMDEVDRGPGSWDATTRIAGEAARFNCVRDAARARTLTDDLIFHDGTVGIRFADLWQTWVEFGNKYGITDAEVRTKLTLWQTYPQAPPGVKPTPKQKIRGMIVPRGAGGHQLN